MQNWDSERMFGHNLLKNILITIEVIKIIINQMQSVSIKVISDIGMEEGSQKNSFVWRMHNQADLDSWMGEYLREERMQQDLYEGEHEVSLVLSTLRVNEPSGALCDPQPLAPASPSRTNNSIFHNFQKNLLSLLKRTVHIKKHELLESPYGSAAFELWKMLFQQQFLSKKALYMTFGVNPQENGNFLRKKAMQRPGIQKLLLKHGLHSIEQSQKLLRGEVQRKAGMLKKGDIEKVCKVKDFANFYRYFLIFVEELSAGALSQRMTKEQRLRHLNSAQ